jgi:plasmid stabilization system protein ParE
MQPGSGAAARRRVQHILAAIRRLRGRPYIGRLGDLPGTRLLAVDRHTVVYAVLNDTGDEATAGDIVIVRVFGPYQDRSRL